MDNRSITRDISPDWVNGFAGGCIYLAQMQLNNLLVQTAVSDLLTKDELYEVEAAHKALVAAYTRNWKKMRGPE